MVGDLSLVGCCWLVMVKICEYFEVHDLFLFYFIDWALKCHGGVGLTGTRRGQVLVKKTRLVNRVGSVFTRRVAG